MKKSIIITLTLAMSMASTEVQAQRFLNQINPGNRVTVPAGGFLGTINAGTVPQTNQIIRYNDGGRFYGTTINGRRSSGRLVEPNGVESLGGFDENGRWNGTVEVTYPAERSWYKGEFSHGTKHGSGSFYKDGKYYDQQYYNGELETSIEVSEPRFKGENWYAKTLGEGTPTHPFFGSGGAGTYQQNQGGGVSVPQQQTPCYGCAGSRKCSNCNGRGTMSRYFGATGTTSVRNCGACGGSGICPQCNGSGVSL